jgi:hypothetical protein
MSNSGGAFTFTVGAQHTGWSLLFSRYHYLFYLIILF